MWSCSDRGKIGKMSKRKKLGSIGNIGNIGKIGNIGNFIFVGKRGNIRKGINNGNMPIQKIGNGTLDE